MSNISLTAKKAAELAANAAELSQELKELAISSAQTTSSVDPFFFALTIFTLSCFIGYYVVWKVTPALHTPLMAVTNAISGIVIIGSMIAMNQGGINSASLFGFVACFLASINVFGGFLVTKRMLDMFKKR